MDLVMSPSNYMFSCREVGIKVPRGTSYEAYLEWLPGYLGSLSDDELVALMNKLGLTVVSTSDSGTAFSSYTVAGMRKSQRRSDSDSTVSTFLIPTSIARPSRRQAQGSEIHSAT